MTDWFALQKHGGRKPSRKSVTEPVSTPMTTKPVSLKPVWVKTGFTKTGFVRPGETGFPQVETGFGELAKPVSKILVDFIDFQRFS